MGQRISPGTTASLIFAAGRGSRMKGYEGNKTLLPLVPGPSPFQGSVPFLLHILENLPDGPKALVIHHRKEEVIRATKSYRVSYCEQAVLNGTGGALLAAEAFLKAEPWDQLIITMGDVPFIRRSTYRTLLQGLSENHFMVLGFQPRDKREYGVLEMESGKVRKIVEWKYWSTYPRNVQDRYRICNAGIYAARREQLLAYLPVMAQRPHRVRKERKEGIAEVEEYFITDLVEWMIQDGLVVGAALAEDAREVMGIDDLSSLRKAQEFFRTLRTK